MDMVRSESNGFEFLQNVTNLALNALISSSYPRMDLFSNPSNHLIVVGPKLEGNILHLKASFLEYMAML